MSTKKRREEGSLDAVYSTHKFYLAFENSICKDYVTEKFFTRMGHMVPIVMGG